MGKRARECLPSPASPSLPASPWRLSGASGLPLSRPPASSPPPHPSLTSTLQPSSSELVPPLLVWLGQVLDRLRLRLAHHRLRQEPWSQAAAVLLRHPGIRPLRGYGAFLSHDGLPPPLCLLRRWRKSWTPLYIIVARSF